MKILTDLHHFDLFHSFFLLFEKRLGIELYRPIGMGWKDEGYWDVYAESPVTECYLSTTDGEAESLLSELPPLGDTGWARYLVEMLRVGPVTLGETGIYRIEDKSKHWAPLQRGITLGLFRQTKFDFVLSSMPQHYEPFKRLAKEQGCPHIVHLGGVGSDGPWTPPSGAKNVMLHSPPRGGMPDINWVSYHQEFDLDVFCPTPIEHPKNVVSWVHFPDSMELMGEVACSLPDDWTFTSMGNFRGPQAGVIADTGLLATMIKASGWTWHIKPGGESYGHIIHNSFACGRPIITNLNDLRGNISCALLEHGKTCIDVSSSTKDEVVKDLIYYTERYQEIHTNVIERFNDVVDFESESHTIKEFLERANAQ